MNAPILEVRQLRKTYGSLVAVADISFAVRPGECLGLLGPNGAGKTTTISMMSGLITPDAGEVLIEGRRLSGDTDPVKSRLGLVPQELALYEDLSARDNLLLFGALYSLDKAKLQAAMDDALKIVGLSDRVRDKVKTYSGGMKRRLNLAAALLHDPQMLLLDEPTVGVDPQSRNAIFENIETLRERGKTILYTTHYMEEVERLCDRVVIIDRGKILADDTLAGLRRTAATVSRLQIEVATVPGLDLLPELLKIPGVQSADQDGATFSVQMNDLAGTAPAVLSLLKEKGQTVAHLSAERPNLESIFLTLTGHQLRDS